MFRALMSWSIAVALTLVCTSPGWSVPPAPPYPTNTYAWTCEFPDEPIEVAPVEGALWLEADHIGCCWHQDGSSYDGNYYPSEEWCHNVPAEITVLNEAGEEIPGDTLSNSTLVYVEGSGIENGGGYGELLWLADEGPLDPETTYTARVVFEAADMDFYGGDNVWDGGPYGEEICGIAESCLNGETCDPETSETGCEGHVDYEMQFTTHSSESPKVEAPEVTATAVSAHWVSQFGCYVPRATFTVEPPQVEGWFQPYLRYTTYRVIGSNESDVDRWGGATMVNGAVTTKEFDWRGWVPGVTDEYCARVEVRSMGPNTAESTTVCLGAEVLPGLDTNEGAPWTTVPDDGPFCSSDSEPVPDTVVPPEEPESESESEAKASSSSSSGCAGGSSPTKGDTTWLILVVGFAGLILRRAGRGLASA